jgi:transposase
MPERRRRFSPQFKAEAVQMVLETGRPTAEVARDLGIHDGTLGNWVNAWRREHPEPDQPLTPVERAHVKELEDEIRRLRMENEFLKKAAAGSTGQRNSDCQLISGGEIVERLAGSGVELQRDRIELCLCVARQVGPFREILAQ